MKTMAARFEQARVFAEVAEQGSFTRAAERLECSKAHASATVAALEAALGVQLLHRTTRRLDLTQAGRAYLEYCRQLRDLLVEAEQAVSAVNTEVSGRLRFTMPSSFGEVFLADIAGEFQRTYPRVQLEADLSVMRRDLAADGFDCAIRSVRVVDPHLIARPLGVMREVAVATPGLLQQHAAIETPQDLLPIPGLVNSSFSDDAHWVFARGAESANVTLQGRLAVNAFSAVKRAVLAHLGVARLPLYLVHEELCSGALVRLLPDWELTHTPLWLVYPQQRQRPLRARVFIEFLQRWIVAAERRAFFA
jgi:DNA-binding transcriptional LysR family regulator